MAGEASGVALEAHIYSAASDGSGIRPLNVEGISLSRGPSGLIAFLHGERVAVIRPDGSHLRVLQPANSGSEDPSPPSWSPNGRLIAAGNGHSCQAFADCRSWTVSIADVRTGRVRAVIPSAKEPSWAADGRAIAYQGGSAMGDRRAKLPYGLYVARADGRGRRELARGGLPAWSPNGRYIAFYALSTTGRHLGLQVIRPNGTGRRSLGRTEAVYSWAPNGRKIAYTGPFFFPSHLSVSAVPGWSTRAVGPVGFANPGAIAWSPNGKSLAWVIFDDRHDLDRLVIAPSNGSEKPREIARTKSRQRIWTPVFSRDGRRVLYSVLQLH